MRRILAVGVALFVLASAAPAAATGSVELSLDSAPSKIYYNTPFTLAFSYVNNSGATVDNPHPMVFLFPDPNLPGNKCDPAFHGSAAELVAPYSTPISENEAPGLAGNCVVWWGFDLTHHWTLPNGSNSNWPGVKITVRPPAGITKLNFKIQIQNPSVPDAPAYAIKQFAIPVATLAPPTAITPTTHAPTSAPTTPASPTEQPVASDSPSASVSADGLSPNQPSTKATASEGLGWWWVALGVILVAVGGAVLVLLFRQRSQGGDLEQGP